MEQPDADLFGSRPLARVNDMYVSEDRERWVKRIRLSSNHSEEGGDRKREATLPTRPPAASIGIEPIPTEVPFRY